MYAWYVYGMQERNKSALIKRAPDTSVKVFTNLNKVLPCKHLFEFEDIVFVSQLLNKSKYMGI